MSINRKRGSIALARQLCYEIAGATSEDDDISGSDYGSVDVAEILSAEIERLREVLAQLEQEPVAKVVSTAPDRIWLDLGFDPQDETEVLFGELNDVTWSQDNASGYGIEYVRATPTAAQPEPTPWREMVVVSLVREGIDKHKARELADHFAAQPAQEPVAWAVQACSKMWRGEFAEIDAKAEAKRIGGTCVAYALYTAPAQRQWQSLTDEDWEKVANRKTTVFDTFEQGATWAAYKLEKRNT